jgi:hypothetical protein
MSKECKHNFITDGHCIDCGELGYEIDNYQSKSLNEHTNNTVKSFEKDLYKINGLSQDIKNWVLKKIYGLNMKICRKDNRRKILFAYIYMAHIMLGYVFEPEIVSKMIGLSSRKLNLSLKLVSGISCIKLPQKQEDNIIIPMVILSPISYILENLKLINIEHMYDEIKIYAINLLNDYPMLYENRPKSMAVAIIKQYLSITNTYVPNFNSIFKSISTLKNCTKMIQSLTI